MKNKYLISPNYLLQLENDELRERVKKLIFDFNELKKLCEVRERQNKIDDDDNFLTIKYEAKEREGMVQHKGDNAIIQE